MIRRDIMYLLAILFPPIAVLMCKKPVQALVNLLLCMLLWLPGMIHALMVVREYKANEMMLRQVELMKRKFE